jgi:hypothetical protein
MNIPRDLCRFTVIATLASAPMTLAIAEPNPTAARATAAFVNRAEMTKWLADGELGLWIQARSQVVLRSVHRGVSRRELDELAHL